LSFGPGIAIKQGMRFSVRVGAGLSVGVYFYGYKVPSADVPATTDIAH